MIIRNVEELRFAYFLMGIFEDARKTNELDYIKIKKQIREFIHKPKLTSWIVKDYGIDGFISLHLLPEFLEGSSIEDVKKYFEEEEVIECPYSAYDCTGRPFTSWYKIFRRHNRWYAYHSVAIDV